MFITSVRGFWICIYPFDCKSDKLRFNMAFASKISSPCTLKHPQIIAIITNFQYARTNLGTWRIHSFTLSASVDLLVPLFDDRRRQLLWTLTKKKLTPRRQSRCSVDIDENGFSACNQLDSMGKVPCRAASSSQIKKRPHIKIHWHFYCHCWFSLSG